MHGDILSMPDFEAALRVPIQRAKPRLELSTFPLSLELPNRSATNCCDVKCKILIYSHRHHML